MAISTIGTNSLASTAQIGSLTTASGSAPSYSARAWVNFNGTGTVAIRASGNVSSITDNGVGLYTVNFATAMPDVDFSISGMQAASAATGCIIDSSVSTARTTTSIRIGSLNGTGSALQDAAYVCVSIFR